MRDDTMRSFAMRTSTSAQRQQQLKGRMEAWGGPVENGVGTIGVYSVASRRTFGAVGS